MRGEQYPGTGYVHKRRFDRAVAENPISEGSATKSDVAASRAGALPFRKSIFIGNYNSQQRGTKMAVSAFQLLGNTLSLDLSLSSVWVAIRDQTLRSYQGI